MPRGKLIDDLTFGPARRRRRERIRTLLVTLTTVALVSGWVLLNLDTPLGRPPTVVAGEGSFEFVQHQPGQGRRPVAYDPCRRIEIVVNDADAPPGAGAILDGALEEISAATGLVLVVTGRTDDRIGPDRRARSMGFAPPVLIDWTTPERLPGLAGRVAGMAGSQALETATGELRYVTGTVALDAPDLTRILRRDEGRAQVRAIIMHELGHLLGLGHVDDPNELMYRKNVGLTALGPGDREGLSLLGSGRCFPGL